MLARLEEGRVHLLRHDFRAVYGCSYDEVPVEEAIDLIRTLPDGCEYVASVDPARSWTGMRHAIADIEDILYRAYFTSKDGPPHVIRPAEMVEMQRKKQRARSVRRQLEDTEWEEA